MSEAKFTLGPWKISRHGELVEIPEISGILLCAGNATANANAALIAAPDLYAALENLLDWASFEETLRMADLGRDARAALAKARGE